MFISLVEVCEKELLMSSSSKIKVLFICTGNSARSIMGEMAANILMGGKFVGYSAGSKPTGSVNNAALDIAKEIRYPLSKLQSKSITPFMSCENHSLVLLK